MDLPTERQIRLLHERFAPTAAAFDLVYTHCRIVGELAEQLLDQCPGLDPDLVRAGSLLHDIGVYRLYNPAGILDHAAYVRHGLLGYDLLRGLGYPERLCRFCSCHTGVGLSRADVLRQRLPLPAADYLAVSDEERLVMYADKFHSKTTPPTFVTADRCASSLARFGADKVALFAALRGRFGDPDLGSLAERYGHPVT